MYGFFAILMLASILAIVGALLQCPWLVTFATGLLLFPLVLYGIIVLVGVAILKVGSDGCAFNPSCLYTGQALQNRSRLPLSDFMPRNA